MIDLFRKYPDLAETLPHTELGVFPTPVGENKQLASALGIGRLYIKQDGLSGTVYGGNKIRKLEFLLGEARARKHNTIITYGAAGSNHALATAIYSRALGFDCINLLIPQHNARYVAKNLLMSRYAGARLRHCRDFSHMNLATRMEQLRHLFTKGGLPYIIPVGGTNPVGTVGFVNAAFELAAQIERKELPEPDHLYVTLGSMGTAAGLALGLRAAKLSTRLTAVNVVTRDIDHTSRITELMTETQALLAKSSPSFPTSDISIDHITIRHDFLGPGYSAFTREGAEAVKTAHDTGGVTLDGTYTGKTFAALMADAQNHTLQSKTVLFWNTLNARITSDVPGDMDYTSLPREFHHYFTEDVQPLDT